MRYIFLIASRVCLFCIRPATMRLLDILACLVCFNHIHGCWQVNFIYDGAAGVLRCGWIGEIYEDVIENGMCAVFDNFYALGAIVGLCCAGKFATHTNMFLSFSCVLVSRKKDVQLFRWRRRNAFPWIQRYVCVPESWGSERRPVQWQNVYPNFA